MKIIYVNFIVSPKISLPQMILLPKMTWLENKIPATIVYFPSLKTLDTFRAECYRLTDALLFHTGSDMVFSPPLSRHYPRKVAARRRSSPGIAAFGLADSGEQELLPKIPLAVLCLTQLYGTRVIRSAGGNEQLCNSLLVI